MRISLAALALATVPIAAVAARPQSPRVVDVSKEPSHHLVLSNARVRVFNVIVAPHATTLAHRHDRDYLFVTLGEADVSTARVGDTAVRLVLHDGEVRYTPGGFTHTATDNLDVPFHNTTIELLQPSTHVEPCGGSCAEPAPCSVARHGACPTVTRLVGADQWTAVSVVLPAAGRLELIDGTGPVLVVALSDVRLTRGGPASGDAAIRGGPGTLGWLSAVSRASAPDGREGAPPRSLINAGREPARFVMLELRADRG